jgi:DNA topoisomerase II
MSAYEQLELHEHVLKRPDTYIGSVRPETVNEWLPSANTSESTLALEELTYIPALHRLFTEALSNAVDNVWRSRAAGIPTKAIKISWADNPFTLSVWNDGQGIPIRTWSDTDPRYIPQVLFGELLTSSNFDDSKERETSGRNGIGISCTNIFSTHFHLLCADGERTYEQEWTDHMRVCGKPKIRKSTKKPFTQITWTPDLAYFTDRSGRVNERSEATTSSDQLRNESVIAPLQRLFYRMALDTAMLTGISVYVNEEKVPVKSFKDYVKLYASATESVVVPTTDGSNVGIVATTTPADAVSFVNGIYTREGGVHVDAWTQAIFKPLVDKISAKLPPSSKFSVKDLKKYLFLVVSVSLPNPEFSSQSKTKLTAPRPRVALAAPAVAKIVSALLKWPFVNEIIASYKSKELSSLKQAERKRAFKKIDGYDPANKIGMDSTLILCEGLSAKTYAVAGIEQGVEFSTNSERAPRTRRRGRDYFGILALRGKVLNTRNATPTMIKNNKEITSIIQALGVCYDVDYTDPAARRSLRYGRVLILADADTDGIHITSLIINLFDTLFPTLLTGGSAPFLYRMKTPIVKISAGRSAPSRFYTAVEAKAAIDAAPKNAQIKYYKGLGTSSNEDIKASFGKVVQHYLYDDEARVNLDKVFAKDNANLRKAWLANPASLDVDHADDAALPITEFIDQEHILFSLEDCKRSIPHLMDGLKESQRKILYACFSRSSESVKVAQLAGYVAERTNYHHGEGCLFDTITKMAQDFCGSNNLPLLAKDGQFGSRQSNGKDAAHARYIYTKLSPWTRSLFPKEDDPLLHVQVEEGKTIEPEFYLPVLPVLLLNGVQGSIGTGWSSTIPSYNPKDCEAWVRARLRGEVAITPEPWVRDFTGTITRSGDCSYITAGIHTPPSAPRAPHLISEIPLGMSIDKCKEHLEDLLEQHKIRKLVNHSTPNKVHFEFFSEPAFKASDLKLTSSFKLSNLVAFVPAATGSVLQRFASIDELLDTWFALRLEAYAARKRLLRDQLKRELATVENKARFIADVIAGDLVVWHVSRKELVEKLTTGRFDHIDTLINLPIHRVSQEHLDELIARRKELVSELKVLKNTPPEKLWERDLDAVKRLMT